MEFLQGDRTTTPNGFDIQARLIKSFREGHMDLMFKAVVDSRFVADRIGSYERHYYNIDEALRQFKADMKQVVKHFSNPIK